jgi:hypothetical protein
MICRPDKFNYVKTELATWCQQDTMTLKLLMHIIGLLRWLTAGFPFGRAHIGHLRGCQNFYEKQGRAKGLAQHQIRCKLPIGSPQREALIFWHKTFSSWDGQRRIFMDFGPCGGTEVLGRVDASTDYGCGGFVYIMAANKILFFVHEWTAEERALAFRSTRESTGAMEAMGLRFWTKLFAPKCIDARLLLELDNESVVRALCKAYSPNRQIMDIVRGVCVRLATARTCLRCCHVTGRFFNRVADCLSHGDIEGAQCLAMQLFGLSMDQVHLPL